MKKSLLNALGVKATKDIPVEDLFNPAIDKENYGLDETDVTKLKALKSFCRAYSIEKPERKETLLKTSSAAVQLMYDIFRGLDHEEVWVAFTNKRLALIDKVQICVGGLDQSTLDTRRIIKNALDLNAHGIILFHNHPGGVSLPSVADIKQTESLKKICDTFEILLLDHIIITDTEYYAFSEEKYQPIP